jgi:hypothetical protein
VSPQRTLWTDLRAIDQAIVPRLAVLARRLRRGAHGMRTSLDRGRGGPRATLERVDGRFARRGVLGLVHDVPQVGFVGIAAMLTVAAITTAVRISGPAEDTSAPDLPAVNNNIATVGPLPGETIPSYLSAAQAGLLEQKSDSPGQQTYAIVDFEAGRTPAEVAAALPNVAPQLIFVQVRVPGDSKTFPSPLPELSAYPALKAPLRVKALPADALSAYQVLATALDRAAADNTTFANSIGAGATEDELTQKAAQLKDARHYRAESSALRATCACIYAVVVRGTPETLVHILDSGKVRAVDAASPGLKLNEICGTPLLPQTKVRQPTGATGP